MRAWLIAALSVLLPEPERERAHAVIAVLREHR